MAQLFVGGRHGTDQLVWKISSMEIVPIFEITMLIWFCWENPGVNNYFINVFFGHNNGAIRSYFKKNTFHRYNVVSHR